MVVDGEAGYETIPVIDAQIAESRSKVSPADVETTNCTNVLLFQISQCVIVPPTDNPNISQEQLAKNEVEEVMNKKTLARTSQYTTQHEFHQITSGEITSQENISRNKIET